VADICIIYARQEGADAAAFLDNLFKERWSVWRDTRIVSGDYRKEIKTQIIGASCVVPIWSTAAEHNAVIHDELLIAKQNGKPILPLRIHKVDAPMGYGSLQVDDAINWRADAVVPAIANLLNRISQTLSKRSKSVGGASPAQPKSPRLTIPLPTFFYSVSSHETRLTPGAALDALNVFGASPILVSAYDMLDKRRSRGTFPTLREMQKKGATILLDSGNYEKARLADASWTLRKYHYAVAETPHDLAFHYDDLDPPRQHKAALQGVIKGVERDAKRTKRPIQPIVHLPKNATGFYDLSMAPKLMVDVARELEPALIGIPERELGGSVFERAATMRSIRLALRELSFHQPVHVLGAGNPTAMALLTAAGADSFDGLEWCRFVMDGVSKMLHHFQHYELFKWQHVMSNSPVMRAAALDDSVPYTGKAIFHNLDSYASWVKQLRAAAIDEKRLIEILTDMVPKEARELAREALPELFS
jgi:queuine/archaeosine tRNA-ribosyltransferase